MRRGRPCDANPPFDNPCIVTRSCRGCAQYPLLFEPLEVPIVISIPAPQVNREINSAPEWHLAFLYILYGA